MNFLRLLLTLIPVLAAGPLSAAPADIDRAFVFTGGNTSVIRAATLDSQNRLLVAGDFVSFEDGAAVRVLRLAADGSLDSSFTTGTGANGSIKAIEILPDQRILLGGEFTIYNSTNSRGLILLQPNGSVDQTFTSGFSSDGFSAGVTCLKAIPNGKMMVGGYFSKYANRSAGRYIMITSTGSLADTRGTQIGANSHVYDIDLLPDGKMLVSGFFTTVDHHPSACVTRLLATGKVDTTFSTTQLGGVAYTVEGQADGKVIIGGNFSNFFGLGQRYLGRLTPTGNLDASYLGNNGPNLNVYGLTLDPQERLIVAGQFSRFQNIPMTGIGRLLPDGSPDPSFTFDRSVSASFFQEYPIDGRGHITAYGWQNLFEDPPKSSFLRLMGGSWAPRESWLFEHFGTDTAFGNSAWDAAPAGDGITNLQKYSLGFQGAPTAPAILWGDGGLLNGFWKDTGSSGFFYSTDLTRTDTTAFPEWSSSLADWRWDNIEIRKESRIGNLVKWKVILPGGFPSAFFRVRSNLSP